MNGSRVREFAFPALIGDIGGTNARFALLADARSDPVGFPTLQAGDFASFEGALANGVLARTALRPRSAVLALAGPIHGEAVGLTNSPWVVEPDRLMEAFALDEVVLLNDFEALSLSLPALADDDLDPLFGGPAAPHAAKLVVGPGTGLGAGALVPADGTWIPVPGEGGHVDLGPVSPRDFEFWPHIARVGGRVSAEMLVSGSGLVRLYRAVAAADGRAARHGTPADIVAAGLGGADDAALDALRLFAVHLGRFAGNLALVFLARGGVYLAGGITSRIAPILREEAFREAFLAKPPHRALLEEMPVMIVAHDNPALVGIAALVQSPERYAVDLRGRHWRRS